MHTSFVLKRGWIVLAALLCAWVAPAYAQENYEIQVYAADMAPKGATMVEFHTNFTFRGTKKTLDGVLPTHHALHETIEITHSFTDWFETGFYIFTSVQPDDGWQWVGDHIRPRFRVPEKWKWPVGISLSTEFGYQRRNFSTSMWSLEIRPIIDKEIGRWYFAFNPTFERALQGPDTALGFEFSPNAKIGFEFTPKISGGIEYYGSLGPISGFDPLREQGQQIMPAIDLNLSPNWEFNFGVGIGVTQATDRLLVKWILGRRFGIKP